MKSWFEFSENQDGSCSVILRRHRYLVEVVVNWVFIFVILFIGAEVGIFSSLLTEPTVGSSVLSFVLFILAVALFAHALPPLRVALQGAEYKFDPSSSTFSKNGQVLYTFDQIKGISLVPFKQKSRDWALFLQTGEEKEFFLCRDSDLALVKKTGTKIAELLSIQLTDLHS